MKKVITLSIVLLSLSLVFAQNNHHFEANKYSTELNCTDSLTKDYQRYLDSAEQTLDLEKYKTIIRHGDIAAIEKPYLDDILLGALSKTELKLFRNMFYAKKGYAFADEDLTKYFNQFEWYKPETKDVTFTDQEEYAIQRIKIFEADSTVNYDFKNRDIVWEAFNGGADQRGHLLILNKNSTFEYIPRQTINRMKNLKGKWKIVNNRIELSVESEALILGGYVDDSPFAPAIVKGTPVTITYDNPLKISLPINESETYKKYNFNFGEKWLQIGSSDCYISHR